jgi:hypothetical protein
MFTLSTNLRRGLLALALSCGAALAQAQTYHIEIDTSSFAASSGSGWLDLQFDGFGSAASAANASISTLSGAFDLSQAVQLSGDAAGSVAGGFKLDSATSFNDVFQAVNYGGKFSFDVTFTGGVDASASAAGSAFTVTAYGADQATLLGKGDPASGSLAMLNWTPASTAGANGTVSVTVFDSATTGVSAVSAVPEPSSWLMLALGAGMVAYAARRRPAAIPVSALALAA